MELIVDNPNYTYTINITDVWNMSNQSSVGKVPDPPLYIYVYVTLMCALIFFVGVVGNILVVQAVIRIRSMRRRMNYFLVCLSVADLLVLLIALPSGLQEFYGKERWHIGDPMCKVVVFSENAAHHCSVLTLLAIGFERYHAICYPLGETCVARLSSESILIPMVWILSCVATLPFAIFYGTEERTFMDGSLAEFCTVKGISSEMHTAYIIFIFTVLFALPLVLLTIMYTAISLTIATSTIPSSEDEGASRTLSSAGRSDKNHSANSKVIAGRRQVVKMMVAVMLTYFVCLLPLRCMQVWTLFATESDFVDLGQEGFLNLLSTSRILMYLNSASNPVIYGLLSSNFRAAFKQSFHTCRLSSNDRGKYNTAYYNQHQTQVSSLPANKRAMRNFETSATRENGEAKKLERVRNHDPRFVNKTISPRDVSDKDMLKHADSLDSEIELITFKSHGNVNRPTYV